jgi:hypothetical protein
MTRPKFSEFREAQENSSGYATARRALRFSDVSIGLPSENSRCPHGAGWCWVRNGTTSHSFSRRRMHPPPFFCDDYCWIRFDCVVARQGRRRFEMAGESSTGYAVVSSRELLAPVLDAAPTRTYRRFPRRDVTMPISGSTRLSGSSGRLPGPSPQPASDGLPN